MQDTPANGKGSQTVAAADKEETAHKAASESPLECVEKRGDGKDEQMKSAEKTVDENEALGENGSKDNEIKKDDLTNAVSDSVAAPDPRPEADLETDTRETSAVENVMETAEEKKDGNESKAGNDKTPAGEETEPSSSDDKTASQETAMPELPKVKSSEKISLFSFWSKAVLLCN